MVLRGPNFKLLTPGNQHPLFWHMPWKGKATFRVLRGPNFNFPDPGEKLRDVSQFHSHPAHLWRKTVQVMVQSSFDPAHLSGHASLTVIRQISNFSSLTPRAFVKTASGHEVHSPRRWVTLATSLPFRRRWYTAWQYSPHCSDVAAQPWPVAVKCNTPRSPGRKGRRAPRGVPSFSEQRTYPPTN